jgi:protein-disulfide isomerase
MISKYNALAAAFALCVAFSGVTAAAAAKSAPPAAFNPAQKAAIEEIVRGYILDHPEILPQAMEVLQKRVTDQSIISNRKQIFEDADSVVGGNPNGDVTIVEFFDYTCGYCKLMSPALNQLIQNDGKIRFIYKEWPVRGPVADFAAHAAIASRVQGKYIAFHDALFAARGQLSEDRVMEIAKQQGIDVVKLKRDMASPQVDAILERNHQLGQQLGLNGTPSFIIGREIVPGAISMEDMAAVIKRARQARK